MSSLDRLRRAAPSRETRLLLLTIAVSVAALLLLAQFRFPDRARTDVSTPVTAPLERLAARASYDELAGIVAQLERRVQPALLVLRVTTDGVPARGAAGSLAAFVPAVRFEPDLALARLPPGSRVQAVVGQPEALPIVLAADPVRHLALVRVPAGPEATAWIWDRADVRAGPRYVAVVEGTRGGPAMRPVFLNRADPVSDPRWDRPLLSLGGARGLAPGTIVFSLEGRLVGMAVDNEDLPAVVAGDLLWDIGSQLASGALGEPGDLGIQVQELTASLSAVTRAEHGVVVSHVDPEGPAAGLLQPADVIDGINGRPVFSPDSLLLHLARTRPGTEVSLRLVRRGERLTVPVEVRTAPLKPPAANRRPELGLTMRNVPGGVEVMRVEPGTAGADADLLPGDRLWLLEDEDAPGTGRIAQAFADAAPGDHVLVGVERDGRRFLTTIEKP